MTLARMTTSRDILTRSISLTRHRLKAFSLSDNIRSIVGRYCQFIILTMISVLSVAGSVMFMFAVDLVSVEKINNKVSGGFRNICSSGRKNYCHEVTDEGTS